MMKKNIFWIFGLISILIIVVLVIIFMINSGENVQPKTKKSLESITRTTAEERVVNETPKQAVQKEVKCKTPVDKNECLALAKRDMNYCYKITKAENDVQECLWWYRLANIIENDGNCDIFSGDQKLICIAITTKSRDACKSLAESSRISFCEEIAVNFADSVKNKDEAGCSGFQTGDFKANICPAMISQNADLCNKYDNINPNQCIEGVE